MGPSVVVGLLVAGILGVILDIINVPAGSTLGAFVGGLVAAWLLYARRGRAATAGFVVGVFSFPVQLVIFSAILSSGLYTPPPIPEISQSELLMALVVGLVMEIVAGTAGGIVGSIVHHPPPGAVEVPRPYVPPPPAQPERYCVQCGTGLAKETILCPACGAKQPQ